MDTENTHIFNSFTSGIYNSLESLDEYDYEHRRKKKRKRDYYTGNDIFDEYTIYSDSDADADADSESDYELTPYFCEWRRNHIKKYRLKMFFNKVS